MRYLTDEEARLINAIDLAFRPMAQAAMLTGARYGDLIKAKVRHFDPDAGTLMLPDPKGGRTLVVYLEGGSTCSSALRRASCQANPSLRTPAGGAGALTNRRATLTRRA